MVVCLVLDTVLARRDSCQFYVHMANDCMEKDGQTAPYLEMCRTNRAPSLKSGNATMMSRDTAPLPRKLRGCWCAKRRQAVYCTVSSLDGG